MDVEEFLTSPAKRRRTDSPERQPQSTVAPTSAQMSSIPGLNEVPQTETSAKSVSVQEDDILDALMQHVESESRPDQLSNTTADMPAVQSSLNLLDASQSPIKPQDDLTRLNTTEDSSTNNVQIPSAPPANEVEMGHSAEVKNEELSSPANAPLASNPVHSSDILPNAEPAVETTRESGQGPEWEIDSSPLNSSDSDSSDVSSSAESDDDDDDDADDEYAMLDPEEQARILMQGDGGSDDEGGKSKDKGEAAPLRTANEKVEEVIPKPDIIVTEDMEIVELGEVEVIVENTVLIKAKVSGEYQVLESGSLLCLKNRNVIGVVAETLGRVQLPMYTVRFTNNKAIEEAGLQKDITIYYVPLHSKFVFTMPLRAVKGSDASNFHDEEVGDDEIEFSDDEAEAEHKRMMKANRRGKRDEVGGRGRGRGGRGGRGNFRGDRQFAPGGDYSAQNDAAYGNGSLEMNYDDMDGVDGGYTPLARPTNFQELTTQNQFLEPESSSVKSESSTGNYRQPYSPSHGEGQGRGGYRGDRGGRRRRGDFGGGRGRGNWDRSSNSNDRKHSYSNDFSRPSSAQQSPGAHFTPNQMAPPPQNPYQYPHQPHPPVLSAQNPPYPNFPFSPSPISPLPNQQFNFGGYGQQQQQQQHYASGGPQFQQQHHQAQLAQPGPHVNPAFMQNFNQAAAAEVQRQLELMRQNGGR